MVNVIATAAATPEYPTWLVCLLGIGIVFLGLICLILLCYVMSGLIHAVSKTPEAPVSAPAAAPAAPAAASMSSEEKGRVIAAISCAVAEELGTAPEAIRITSIKRV